MSPAQTAAFRPCWHADDHVVAAPRAYRTPEAAKIAAPVLNTARILRGKPLYTHVAEMQAEQLLRLLPLEGGVA